ncbi:DUF4760 domain-containing protein [Eupransor demetentiae]|uniref:DUF4760 domain-containing protein n=1 Tax=Eupransor demetentiae TaxID=3109584 RepID=A0ABM9N670_9LACO|nr:hypothetical protein R54876_GBNLAHCA_01011 [Lactobacillaceae bacterium LMG 33000]
MVWDNILKFLQGVSYLTGIIGVLGVWIALNTYKENKKNRDSEGQREVIKTSIEVLGVFANDLIPSMILHEDNWRKLYNDSKISFVERANGISEKQGNYDRIKISDLNETVLTALRVKAKLKTGMLTTFNILEQMSVYMNYNLVDNKLIYSTVHAIFINFVSDNFDVLRALQSEETPFNNLEKLFYNWKNYK